MNDKAYDRHLAEYILFSKLRPYLPAVKRWWEEEREGRHSFSMSAQPVKYTDLECTEGLFARVFQSPSKSPIKGVSAFPFVPTQQLQIAGIPCGATKMVEDVCAEGLILEGFMLIERHNIASLNRRGQVICFIPAEKAESKGSYIYLTAEEQEALVRGIVLKSVAEKCLVKK